ncbi:hypothetical protein [Silvibacterium dinghuense]|uniref:Uncharacterized protein n=2 Tax=Silvibacterium dinghuense TaxID=1560006 RepID=A0A4Q1SD98_9BACT|nr:hypothetical protein [Silvibacterium dinghuense]RXS95035.1 hypothetical protein ESZ00_10430 [Silvibacterium dinghuense]
MRCSTCAVTFPSFEFSGDTDMATDGFVAATSMDTDAVALGVATVEEYRAGYSSGQHLFAARVRQKLDLNMVAIDFVRYEDHRPSSPGRSFQLFQESYRPPEAIYACPICGGDAHVEQKLTPEVFRDAGGQLILVDGLTLRST